MGWIAFRLANSSSAHTGSKAHPRNSNSARSSQSGIGFCRRAAILRGTRLKLSSTRDRRAIQGISPVFVLLFKRGDLGRIVTESPREALIVRELCLMAIDTAITLVNQAIAVVDIVIRHSELRFVESADVPESDGAIVNKQAAVTAE